MLSLSGATPVLAIEASTAAGSVALFRGGVLLGALDVPMGAGRADGLFPAVRALLASASLEPLTLGAVVCGAGPGSFTSLRIAAALTKGIAYGAQRPLFAVPSLLLAAASLPREAAAGNYVVHADALRGERYVLVVRRHADGMVESVGTITRVAADLLAVDTRPAERVTVGAPIDSVPSAFVVTAQCSNLPFAGGAWRATPVDLASWEPAYGRLAEAQVKWEANHGFGLPSLGTG